MRVSYVSCICNSFGSHETYHCLYGKTQRCSCSGFRFVKHIILRNRSYVNMALNSRGRRMSEKNGDCSILAHAFVGRSNPFRAEAFLQLYDQQKRPVHMYYFILRGLSRTRNNSIPLWSILTVITNCTTCNIQRFEIWPRASISDTWLKTQF